MVVEKILTGLVAFVSRPHEQGTEANHQKRDQADEEKYGLFRLFWLRSNQWSLEIADKRFFIDVTCLGNFLKALPNFLGGDQNTESVKDLHCVDNFLLFKISIIDVFFRPLAPTDFFVFWFLIWLFKNDFPQDAGPAV